jgi:uncharacterized protein YdeI (YjbR/CyaY-like superfamily)
MKQFDERVDIYIQKSAPFAQEILNHLRKVIHQASPLITETIKWSFPHFEYKATICSMASFKAHCAFGFWKASLMKDPEHLFGDKSSAMGQMGRITKLSDLPSDEVLIAYIHEALQIDQAGIKVVKVAAPPKAPIEMPQEFGQALAENQTAKFHYDKFSHSQKREYLEWITEAKTEATKLSRLATAIEWIAEGKSRHWKYHKK